MKIPKSYIPHIPIQSKPLNTSSSSTTSVHLPPLSYLQSSYATNLSKRHRSEKACDSCRRRKVRCEIQQDGGICRQCLSTKGECTFTTRPRKRGPRGVEQLEERLERLERLLADRTQENEQNSVDGVGQQKNGSRQMETNERLITHAGPKRMITGINNWIYRMCGIDKETSDTLVKIYFAYVYPIIPVVDKAGFLQQYRDQVDILPSPPLLCAIYGVAVRYIESCKAFGNHTKPLLLNNTGQRTSDAWAQQHMEYVKSDPYPTISAIQSLVISVHYRSSTNSKWSDVWLLNSVAVRMAQDIGLHRNDQDAYLSESDKETRKRLWGLIYILDRWFSAGTGRPLAAFDEDCDETYPQPIHVDELRDKSIHTRPSPYQTNLPLSALDIMNHPQLPLFQTVAQLAKISKILGNILHELYTPMAKKQCMRTKSADVVGVLEDSLGVWRRNLPSFLQIQGTMVNWNSCQDESVAILSGAIGLCYYTALILLHRPFIQMRSSTASSQLSHQVCTNAAIRTVDIIGKLQSRDHLLVIWSFIIYPVFVSSLIHLYNANSSNSMVADVAKANLLRILTTLQLFGKLSPLAEKLHTALYCVAQHRQYLPRYNGPSSTDRNTIPSLCSHQPKTTLHECTIQPLSTPNHTNISGPVLSSLPTSSDYCHSIMDWIDSKCAPLSMSDYGNSDHPFDMGSLFGLAFSDCSYRGPAYKPFTTLGTNGNDCPTTQTDKPAHLYEDFQLYSNRREPTTRPSASLKRSFYPGNIFWDLPSGMDLNGWPTHPGTQPVS